MLPNGETLDIQWIKTKIWPQASEMKIPREKLIRGMQANIFSLDVKSEDGSCRTFLVKRIVPKELPQKESKAIWLEFVGSVRSEIDFYANLLKPENQGIRNLFPSVYYSGGTDRSLDCTPEETSFILIMDDLSMNYYQTPFMDKTQAKSVMQSLAKLHAHFWNCCPTTVRGGFWTLERRRKYKEVENVEENWASFLKRFPELVREADNVENLGTLVKEKAEYLDQRVEDGACTMIHGDAKGWNFFFGQPDATPNFLLIDLQWAGRGHPLQDVAYSLTSTLSADHLEAMDDLVDFYVSKLEEELNVKGLKLPPTLRTSFDDVWLDYARVIISGLWRKLNKESIVLNQQKVGPSMINRSWEHVVFITRRISRLLRK